MIRVELGIDGDDMGELESEDPEDQSLIIAVKAEGEGGVKKKKT